MADLLGFHICVAVFFYRNDSTIQITTPAYSNHNVQSDDVLIDLVLNVDGETIETVEFVYKPDPIIMDVFPLKSIQACVRCCCFN